MTATMNAAISGMGWVSAGSMGYPGHVHNFETGHALPELKRKNVLKKPYKAFGRMDPFSKQGFSAAAFALQDAGIQREQDKQISLVAATRTGCLGTDMKFWQTAEAQRPSPATFAYTLDASFLGELCICYGLTGETFVVNENPPDGLTALFMAIDLVDSGQSDGVLCGVCNDHLPDRAENKAGYRPGALFFFLEKEQEKTAYGRIQAASLTKLYFEKTSGITGLYGLAEHCGRPDI